jgi:CBS domain-containing protein
MAGAVPGTVVARFGGTGGVVVKVRDLMRTEVVTLRVDDALDIASDIMSLGRIRHLPVLDRGGSLAGLVTQRDLLRASVSSVLGLAARTQREWLEKVVVRDVMTKEVVTLPPEASLYEAVNLMLTAKFGCIPVVHDGNFVGLITETDCLRSLRELLLPRQ